MSKGHENVAAWQKAHQFVLDVYRATASFPPQEQYGVTSQIRRAAVSVPTNIAEGKSRGSEKEYLRFLYISRGSCAELEYLLLLSKDLGYLEEEAFDELNSSIREVGKMINGLINAIL